MNIVETLNKLVAYKEDKEEKQKLEKKLYKEECEKYENIIRSMYDEMDQVITLYGIASQCFNKQHLTHMRMIVDGITYYPEGRFIVGIGRNDLILDKIEGYWKLKFDCIDCDTNNYQLALMKRFVEKFNKLKEELNEYVNNVMNGKI